MVALARASSLDYRGGYHHLPEWVADPTLLPVTDKKQLMVRFDDWVTDHTVTSEDVRACVDGPT